MQPEGHPIKIVVESVTMGENGWQDIAWGGSNGVGIPPIEYRIKRRDRMTLWFPGSTGYGSLLYFRINDGPITKVVPPWEQGERERPE